MSRLGWLCLFVAALIGCSVATALENVDQGPPDAPPRQKHRSPNDADVLPAFTEAIRLMRALGQRRVPTTGAWQPNAVPATTQMPWDENLTRFAASGEMNFSQRQANAHAVWSLVNLPLAQGPYKPGAQLMNMEDLERAEFNLECEYRRQQVSSMVLTHRRLCRTEMNIRLAILQSIRDLKVEYGDYRNPRFWEEKNEVFYVKPEVSATEAILDVGRQKDDRGIVKDRADALYCTPLAQILILQGHIAIATTLQREAWDAEWKKLVSDGFPIPNEVPGVGESRFWVTTWAECEPGALPGAAYDTSALRPGDNIYIENSYYTDAMVDDDRYRGEEGSNLFYLGTREDGEGLVAHPHTGEVYTLTEYRQHILDTWASTIDTDADDAGPARFKITYKRSPIVTP